jgi:hypothetical protein
MSSTPHIKSFVETVRATSQGFDRGQMFAMFPAPVDPMGPRSNLVHEMAMEHARRNNTPILFLNLEAT